MTTNLAQRALLPATPSHAGDFIHTIYRNFSLEHAFLVALVGRRDAGRRRLLELWAARIDWHKFQRIASPELFAYLGHALSEAGLLRRCPASLQEQVHNRQRFTAAQWLRWRLELRHIVRLFGEHRIDLLVLKGAVLTATAYPDTCLRSMSDIDLLVRPADAERALRLLETAGFCCPNQNELIRPIQLRLDSMPAGAEVSLPLQKTGTRAFIEVHTQLESAEPQYPASIDELWGRAEELDLCGLPCKTLDTNEFLLHLIMHLSDHHLFEHGLRALLDVHLWILLRDERLDWRWIVKEATRRGYAPWVYLTLRMARDALASPVPDAVFSGLGEPVHRHEMEGLAYEQILADGRVIGDVPLVLIRALAQASLRGAARLILRRMMPSRATLSGLTVRGGSQPQLSAVQWRLQGTLNDVRSRVPKYYRAWRAGRMRWSSLRQAAGLARNADRLRNLVQSEARSVISSAIDAA